MIDNKQCSLKHEVLYCIDFEKKVKVKGEKTIQNETTVLVSERMRKKSVLLQRYKHKNQNE